MKAISTRRGMSARAVAMLATLALLLAAFVPAMGHGHSPWPTGASADSATCRIHAPPGQSEPMGNPRDCGAGCTLCAAAGRSDGALAAILTAVAQLIAPPAAALGEPRRTERRSRPTDPAAQPPFSRGPPSSC